MSRDLQNLSVLPAAGVRVSFRGFLLTNNLQADPILTTCLIEELIFNMYSRNVFPTK